jgi:hypothetical protein
MVAVGSAGRQLSRNSEKRMTSNPTRGAVSLHPRHGASREMQMTRLFPLCRGDRTASHADSINRQPCTSIVVGVLTQSCSEIMLFFPRVVSVIIASGAEREISMSRMCACLLWCCLWRQQNQKRGKNTDIGMRPGK